MARRESLSEIRAANPDLGLTGNIISVAFNIPYSFTYRKGSDWVSPTWFLPLLRLGRPQSLQNSFVQSPY